MRISSISRIPSNSSGCSASAFRNRCDWPHQSGQRIAGGTVLKFCRPRQQKRWCGVLRNGNTSTQRFLALIVCKGLPDQLQQCLVRRRTANSGWVSSHCDNIRISIFRYAPSAKTDSNRRRHHVPGVSRGIRDNCRSFVR